MKFTVIWSHALLIGTVFAGLAERMERRSGRVRRAPDPLPAVEEGVLDERAAHVTYTGDWAGAVLSSPPTGTTFTSVSAKFVVPKPSGDGSTAVWVGIDGYYGALSSILQVGLDLNSSADGSYAYDCWYEWYPANDVDFTGISFKAGDSVALSVHSTSKTTGVATVQNLSTGKTVSKNLENSAGVIGQNAEWIVEEYEDYDGSRVKINNFGTVHFTSASAGLANGKTVGLTGATVLDIKLDNTVYTQSSTSGTSDVIVKYITSG